MRVTLIFPPATDPRAPHLALPSLAAVLRRAGVDTALLDADVEGLIALLQPARLASAAKTLGGSMGRAQDDTRRRLVGLGDHLAEAAPHALATLRDKVRFYDPHAYNHARSVITDALSLVSAASPGTTYGIAPIRYDVDGIDAAVCRDLIAVTGDETKNLFSSHWEDDLVPRVAAQNPDLVGITITNRQQLIPGLFLARRLRRAGFFVVLGGTVLTKFVDPLKRRPAFFEHFADAIVVYEGETALLALLEQLETGRDFSKVPNLLYLDRGAVRQTPTHVEDVERLPTPDFGGLPLDRYLAPDLVLPILTGKGCYFNRCKFCDIPYINHVSQKAYRLRRPETVAGDCVALEQRFGCRHFEITDEALSPKLLKHLVDALRPCGARRFSFVGYGRLEPGFTPDLCRDLAEVGFKKLFFGLESGSQKTLDHMDKGVDVRDAPIVLQNVRAAGINFHLFSMIGFPQETEDTAHETFAFFLTHAAVIDSPGNSFDIHPFGLELRTRYFSESASLGVVLRPEALAKDFVIGLPDGAWSNSEGLSQADVERWIAVYLARLRQVYSRHHNTPGHLWPGFEEYAVLYADHYAGREFPFRTSLPDARDPQPYRLALDPSTRVEEIGGRAVLRGRHATVEISADNLRFILRHEPETFGETARLLEAATPSLPPAAAESVYRRSVHSLIGRGLVEVHLAPRPGARAAGEELRSHAP